MISRVHIGPLGSHVVLGRLCRGLSQLFLKDTIIIKGRNK